MDIIFPIMCCKHEYHSSNNIITMVTILLCALTVTKYDLPSFEIALQYQLQVVENKIGIKRKLLVRSTVETIKVDICMVELILALIIATLLKKKCVMICSLLYKIF